MQTTAFGIHQEHKPPLIIMEEINWSDLQLDKKKNLELVMLRKLSYSRYSPPNMYMMYLFWGMLLLGLAVMFFLLSITTANFPHPERVSTFWTAQAVLISLGCYLLYRYFPAQRLSDQRWEEMEGIRKKIDDELRRRDGLLGV